ncbi:MAG: InlB B-repeat-containing protein [Bacteroidaceae bacterium]|nr:InlB B-repeat-containing protein [Bacteroidaceae bacterium]MBR5860451.1 InlB B-repeat-containing protein [Bacteroidaceae bacterium]
MNSIIRNAMLVLLLVLGSTPALYAQYNPVNPPEPEENIYYNITVACSPANVAYTYGAGKYLEGTSRSISYSLRNNNYTFSHWTLNGERYSDKTSFTYTVAAGNAAFVAHFAYTPTSPQEPSVSDEYKLTLTSNNDAACSFNRNSVTRVKFDSTVTLTAYVNQGYEFLGWYKGATIVSSNSSFNYLMPAEDVTLVAKFRYNPFNPSEPDSDGSQSNVQTTAKGDVNKDGAIDVLDIVAVVNYSLKGGDDNLSTYDITGDGVVTILDIVKVVNLSLE